MPEEEELKTRSSAALMYLRQRSGLLAVGRQRFLRKLITDIKTAAGMRHALMQPTVCID